MSTRTLRACPGFKGHPIAALVVICLSVFVISVDATIVNVALPTLSRELDADTAQLQWIVDAYTLVMAGLMLSAGSLTDRLRPARLAQRRARPLRDHVRRCGAGEYGRRLIAARAAMGVGAAVIFPTTLSLITNIFTDPVKRAKAIGLWAAMVGVGVAAGPITGGWLLEHFSWGSVFMVNVPVAAVAIVGGVLFVPTSRDPAAPPRRRARLDPVLDRHHRAGLHRHRGAQLGLEQRAHRGGIRGRGRRSRRVRAVGAAQHRIRCSTCRCSSTGGSPAAVWR